MVIWLSHSLKGVVVDHVKCRNIYIHCIYDANTTIVPHITAPAPYNGQQASTTARRQLYATHLPVPDAMHLVEQHKLYAGTLAVDWKDSSDAYVVCEELGRIYIYGSRNRNRALHGDMVAVELVDVETMMAEKAAKKQARRRSSVMLSTSLHSIPENAPSPTYCGRVVSILERPKRMLFSGYVAKIQMLHTILRHII